MEQVLKRVSAERIDKKFHLSYAIVMQLANVFGTQCRVTGITTNLDVDPTSEESLQQLYYLYR